MAITFARREHGVAVTQVPFLLSFGEEDALYGSCHFHRQKEVLFVRWNLQFYFCAVCSVWLLKELKAEQGMWELAMQVLLIKLHSPMHLMKICVQLDVRCVYSNHQREGVSALWFTAPQVARCGESTFYFVHYCHGTVIIHFVNPASSIAFLISVSFSS